MPVTGDVVIRPAVESDLDEVHGMLLDHLIYQKIPNPVTRQTFRRDSGLCADQMHPYFHLTVVERTSDNKLLGYALHCFYYKTSTGRSLYLQDLHVREAARKSGIGAKLVKEIAAIAVRHECPLIKLHVLDWNPAVAFYHKIGFKWNGVQFNTRLEYDMDQETITSLAAS